MNAMFFRRAKPQRYTFAERLDQPGRAVDVEVLVPVALGVARSRAAFIALVAMVNYGLGFAGLSLQQIFGWVFSPIAWVMGNRYLAECRELGDDVVVALCTGDKIGEESLDALIAQHVPLPDTVEQITGSGGRHGRVTSRSMRT